MPDSLLSGIRQLRVEKVLNLMGLPLFDDEIFYHMFRTNTLRATAVVVEPNLMKKASVVFAIVKTKQVQ